MFFKVRNRAARAFHDWRCRQILSTPPIDIRHAPLIFCSMVSQRDLIMYLVAIKSIYRHVGEGEICIINDGSLTNESIGLLHRHLGSPRIINIADIKTTPCPRGGAWERFLTVLDLAETAYVIQVDSDILARSAIPEVVQCYRENRSFLIGTSSGRDFVAVAEAARFAETINSKHVQILAEKALARLKENEGKLYVRGCAGFAGYAHGMLSRTRAQALSSEMQGLVGDCWKNWGSEQFTSNFLIANTSGSRVLPYPKYINYAPDVVLSPVALLHFIGDWRFYRGRYAAESRQIIQQLLAAAA